MKKIIEKIKEWIKKIVEKIKDLLAKIPGVCLLYTILAMFLTSIFALPLHGAIEWPMIPVIALGILVVFIKIFTSKKPDLECALYYLVGALLIQILCWIPAINV